MGLQMPRVSTNRPLLLDFHLRSNTRLHCRHPCSISRPEYFLNKEASVLQRQAGDLFFPQWNMNLTLIKKPQVVKQRSEPGTSAAAEVTMIDRQTSSSSFEDPPAVKESLCCTPARDTPAPPQQCSPHLDSRVLRSAESLLQSPRSTANPPQLPRHH